MVLGQLARLHSCNPEPFQPAVNGWNYDAELRQSAEQTAELYGRLFVQGTRIGHRPMLKTLERVSTVVADMRRQAAKHTGNALLHGDAHPGNVIVRAARQKHEAVLLDWGRARLGSPLEDVTSWVHSLGFWEPEARRIHDSLLVGYLQQRGLAVHLSKQFRIACWLAGACNAMAGALRYHLAVAADKERAPEQRWISSKAASDWLRILRRADAVWRR
jgi:aminoglycoside phosphotransferase (APT) family kinase protein